MEGGGCVSSYIVHDQGGGGVCTMEGGAGVCEMLVAMLYSCARMV